MNDFTDLLKEFERRADDAWKPMRVFRSEQEAEMDEIRREVWEQARDLVSKFANTAGTSS